MEKNIKMSQEKANKIWRNIDKKFGFKSVNLKTESEFTRGYTCACANLVRITGNATGTLECELLSLNVSSIEDLRRCKVDDSDIEVLTETITEINRIKN